jgi:hypothetical protein
MRNSERSRPSSFSCREFRAGQSGEGGEQVDGGGDAVAGFASADLAGPAHDGGDAPTAFPSGHFGSTKRTWAAAVVADLFVSPRAVVAGENDKRVVIDAEFFQLGEDVADGGVEFFDGVAIQAAL